MSIGNAFVGCPRGGAAAIMLAPRSALPDAHYCADAVVSLTFDDGPDPDWTPPILDALARAGARATFFVVADQIERRGGACVLRAVADAGHEVHIHGASHTPHTELDRAGLSADVTRILDRLREYSIPRPCLWRPPYGRVHPIHSADLAGEAGLQLILWTYDAGDYSGRSWREMLRGLDAALYEDSVILLHDSRCYAPTDDARETVALVEPLVELIRARGFEVEPLQPPPVPRPRRAGENMTLVPPRPSVRHRGS